METITHEQELLQRAGTIEAAIAYLGDTDEEVINYKKLLTAFDDPSNHLVNYQKAIVLVRAVNEKREPDWDSNEWKYWNWFQMGGSSGFRFDDCVYWCSYSLVGSRLCYINDEDGRWLANQHLDVFKNFMLITKK